MDLSENPFSQLFPSVECAAEYRDLNRGDRSEPPDPLDTPPEKLARAGPTVSEVAKNVQQLNSAIEDIFLFTLNKYSVVAGDHANLVFLSSLADIIGVHNQSWIDQETLEQALFERLMLEDPRSQVVTRQGSNLAFSPHLIETRLVHFLLESYRRSWQLGQRKKNLSDEVDNIQNLIIQNLATAFREPDLYSGQNLQEQLTSILMESYEVEDAVIHLLDKFALRIKADEGNTDKLEALVKHILARVKTNIADTSLILFSTNTIIPILYFIKNPVLARIFILDSYPAQLERGSYPAQLERDSYPAQLERGSAFQDTLLGSVLKKSCIPPSDMGTWDYFHQPSGQPGSVHGRTEAQIWSGIESVHSAAHTIFNSLFRCGEDVKHLALLWIGECLHANAGRGKIWTAQMGALMSTGFAGDGFMLNLGSTLLAFINPVTDKPDRMDKVDGSYGGQEVQVSEDARLHGLHVKDLHLQTCLITLAEGQDRPSSSTYNFPTEIFFMAHRALDLGFRTVQEKFTKLNQEINRLQATYRDVVDGGGGGNAAEDIQRRMEESMQKFLTIKAALLEPSTLEKQTSLVAGTSSWLVKLVTESASPSNIQNQTDVPAVLACIPEFVIENICEHILLIRRFNPAQFEQCGHRLGEVLNLILVYMGKPIWLKNPHLRARLAESLECLLPHHENPSQPNILGNFHRQALFQEHPGRLELVNAILHVFVSIEETGQAVQFEQKFSYRRPMYDVIKYLWTLDEFKAKFSELAEEAEQMMESETPPIFLRFINLLINDAIFLLDEGLNYMRTLQEQEGEREGWSDLSAQERTENERQYAHTGQLAKYHNLMGKETIGVLELMTEGLTAVLTNPIMTDRLASMLNYFLKTLTGPQRKSFKVSNLDKYSFKPGEVVAKITQIYINLGASVTFLSSVSSDGRSYSADLFSWTETVLIKIGRADLVSGLNEIAVKVAASSSQQAEEDELLADAPEEFLCPIMSVLMTEPVLLPSSRKIVDRSTISRHLLSDQSDPFNRSPLSMDQVRVEEELKQRIQDWIKQQRDRKAA